MSIEHLEITGFRLVAHARMDLAPGANLFLGENAQGKTTILEAVCYLARGRSFRTNRDRECLPHGGGAQAVASAEARFQRKGLRRHVRGALTPGGKTFWLDGKPLRRVGELWGVLPVVTFLPDDLQLVRGGPVVRRLLLDTLLAETDPFALSTMQGFEGALRHRNALIRQHAPAAQFPPWEAQMAGYAATLVPLRRQLVARLGAIAAEHVAVLSGSNDRLQLGYDTGWPASSPVAPQVAELDRDALEPVLAKAWAESRQADQERGYTQHGPQRADLTLTLNGRDARAYASQGQARTLALALRLAERQVLEELTGEPPILLLDDVLGELDRRRSEYFVRLLSRQGVQSLLTATDAAPLEGELPIGARFTIHGGTASRR